MAGAAGFDEGRARRLLRLGLGGLWLLDTLLQLQPAMFTPDVISGIMQPAGSGNVAWLSALIAWAIRLVAPRLVAFNWAIVAIQLLLGAALLSGRRRAVRAGLWGSLAFGLTVWVFGEGMGQVLVSGASVLSGTPGSAFFYACAAALLLVPPGTWTGRRRADLATVVVAGNFLLGALLQLTGGFWSGFALETPFANAYIVPQPALVRLAIEAVANLAANRPVALNLALTALFAGLAVALLLAPRSAAAFWAMLALVFAVWVFGQDAGMLWGGLATDPNSGPILALLLLAGRAGGRGRRAGGGRAAGGGAEPQGAGAPGRVPPPGPQSGGSARLKAAS